MSDRGESPTVIPLRRLSDAIRDVKNAAADREDVVVELREATRMRLQLLAVELAPVFAEVPTDIDTFDFAISSGLNPRLWIDSVSHVSMGRDRRTYRFLKDTRVGRVVLAESPEMTRIADQVTRYVAERIVERERMMEGHVEEAVAGALSPRVHEADEPLRRRGDGRWNEVMSGLWLVVAGGVVGLIASVVVLWDRLVGMRQ